MLCDNPESLGHAARRHPVVLRSRSHMRSTRTDAGLPNNPLLLTERAGSLRSPVRPTAGRVAVGQ